jgi:hypothetical protein
VELKPEKVQTNDDKSVTFRFTIVPETKNVDITGYRFMFGDGSSAQDVSVDHIERSVNAGGSLRVEGQVKTSAGISAVSEACSATVTVAPPVAPPPVVPPTGQVLGASLPATGPEAALGGIAGVSAIGVASRAYLRSRKSLLDSMRRKRRNQ